ncbi:MAG: 2-oxoglutarate dehydrogenase complex dihydrolipoyllysine-residue succinyltransferase [Myxococcota bacterium]|nr:2-oxoglutarate dehydrogenase complex dihydrolipoyllysine-residue succinyltransferase [Myxococcota bacterium]
MFVKRKHAMTVDVTVPDLGESISEVEVGAWLKAVGDPIEQDAPLVEIESEKASIEVPAPVSGTLVAIVKQTGEAALIGELLGQIDPEPGAARPKKEATAPPSAAAPSAAEPSASTPFVMPAARRVLDENHVPVEAVTPTGPGGRVLKEDALTAVAGRQDKAANDTPPNAPPPPITSDRGERTLPMTPIRRTIARRLVQAKKDSALLTTFNEIDMSAVKRLRAEVKEAFEKQHGVRLGFMSFFVKATVASLKRYEALNAEIRGDAMVYRDYCDIGIAIGSGKGLVVPVIRNAERLGFAGIEQCIADFGARAKTGGLTLEELEGGTFTISNGGVYGSMLSTPIVNPPQSGVLGLHAIKDRPVAIDGQIVIRPIMYVALTYDHRIVDGREAVTFLKEIKERIESPGRLLVEV